MPDYPDFTQYAFIDIVAQTLGEVINRPVYGGALVSVVMKAVTANADTELISITGEGMIYGGCIAVWGGGQQKDSIWINEIDGNEQCPATFDILFTYNMGQPHGTSPIITRFDEVNYQYGSILPYGITFEEALKAIYREEHGGTPTVLAVMTYALA